jgi:hypothetical protein
MDDCAIGCTIALPGYQNIKIEVSGEGYNETKYRLREILLSMSIDPVTTNAITDWWKKAFGKDINIDTRKNHETN